MTRLHLVDGTYELFRQHFSKRPPHRSPDGKDRKATAGVAGSILSLLQSETEKPTHIAVAFDNPIRSFRNDLYDGYKTEAGVPPELLDQFDPIEEAMRALGVTVWSMDQWECDDALATGAARYGSQVDQVRIMTPDKDLGQCVSGTRVVQVDRMREKEYDEEAIRALRGVAPRSIPDLLALIGDDADGIPGIPGFGAKTAAALLAKFETIEKIPLEPTTWPKQIRGAGVLAGTLAGLMKEALLYKKLATLVEDVPLAGDLETLRWRGVPRERFIAWCDTIGLSTLKDRPKKWA